MQISCDLRAFFAQIHDKICVYSLCNGLVRHRRSAETINPRHRPVILFCCEMGTTKWFKRKSIPSESPIFRVWIWNKLCLGKTRTCTEVNAIATRHSSRRSRKLGRASLLPASCLAAKQPIFAVKLSERFRPTKSAFSTTSQKGGRFVSFFCFFGLSEKRFIF